MKKPSYLSDESWKIINYPENAFQRCTLGFFEPGEVVKLSNGLIAKFIINCNRKKDAIENMNQSNRKISGYLNGKYERGWVVYELTKP